MMAIGWNRAISDALQSLGDGRQRIDRIHLGEYQFAFGIDDIEFGVYTSAQLVVPSRNEKIIFFADWRKRNASSFAFCAIVGRVVKSVSMDDRGIDLGLEEFGTLRLERTRDGENFFVNAPRVGGLFVY